VEKVVEKLDAINKTLERILAVIGKTEHKAIRILAAVGTGVSALGFTGLIDIVRKWFVGG
jgi:hypothetical protein